MSWFNYIGLTFIAVIVIPNIVYAVKCKNKPNNVNILRAIELFEQIGRYGSILFMIFNIPYTYLNFWFDGALLTYIIVNCIFLISYLVCWIIFADKSNMAKAVALSVLPSCIFLFSGAMLVNIPLLLFAIIFAAFHIIISCKNIE